MAYLEAAWWFISSNHLTLAGAITMGLVIAGITRRNLFNQQGKGEEILFSPSTLSQVTANELGNFSRSFQEASPSLSSRDYSDSEVTAEIQELVDSLANKRGSIVIPLIHSYRSKRNVREERFDTVPTNLGHDCLRFFLSELENSPSDSRLDVVLHSNDALEVVALQIARAIKAHKGETTVYVPYYAKGLSGLIALAADSVVMAPSAHISFISFIANIEEKKEAAVRKKGARNADDETLLSLHNHKNWKRELGRFVCEVLHRGSHGDRCQLGTELATGKYSESNPIGPSLAKALGMTVTTDVPSEALELVRAFQLRHVPATQEGDRGGAYARAQSVENSQKFRGVCRATCTDGAEHHMKRMEEQRGSRVLCVIHEGHMESSDVDELTAIEILRALGNVDPKAPCQPHRS